MKKWHRAWKLRRDQEAQPPEWQDLFEHLAPHRDGEVATEAVRIRRGTRSDSMAVAAPLIAACAASSPSWRPKNCISWTISSDRGRRGVSASSSACFEATSNGAIWAMPLTSDLVVEPAHRLPVDRIAQPFGEAPRFDLRARRARPWRALRCRRPAPARPRPGGTRVVTSSSRTTR